MPGIVPAPSAIPACLGRQAAFGAPTNTTPSCASGGASLLDVWYDYTPTGNILTKTTEHGNYAYDYDLSSRLTAADNPVLNDEAYNYDNVGNRTSASNAGGSISHNLNNELELYGETEYTYDGNGNLTEKGAGSLMWSYEYNAANRLVHAEDGTAAIVTDYGPG